MNISNIIKYIIIVFIIIFFNNSCTQILKEDDKNEIILNSKVIDLKNIIEKGNFKNFEILNSFWQSQNQKSYIIEHKFLKYSKVNFGKGINEYNYMISNPILNDNFIYIVDNNSLFTKYNIISKEIEFQIKINKNIKKDTAWPASSVTTNNLIIIGTGNGTIQAFDFSGNLIWLKNFNMNIRTPLYLLNDIVITFLSNGKLIGVNSNNGSTVWEFKKDYDKISSIYGGKFYEYRNNLFAVSPKGNTFFIDNFFYEFSDLEKSFNENFISYNKSNYDYNLKLSAYKNYLIIIENNKKCTLFDLNSKKSIFSFILDDNKFTKIINNSIFTLDEKNYLYAINFENNKLFWKSNISDYINKKTNILNIIESNDYIILFLNNGSVLFIDRLNGNIEKNINLKVKDINSLYLHKEYILLITNKGKLHLFN